MTAPSVSITRARAQVRSSPGTDFAMCVIGCASASPLPAGSLSQPYASPAAFAADYSIGDGVDAVTQALTKTNDNPSPPPVAFYATPATTAGAMGAIDHTLTTGTAVPTASAAAAPLGTWQVRTRVVTGGTLGTAGIVLESCLDGTYGAHWLPTQALGTATSHKVYLPTAVDTGAGVDFLPAAGTLTALRTKLTLLQTTLTGSGHFTIVSGSPAIHDAADTTDDTALAAIPAATTAPTTVALFNAILSRLGTHGASAVYHTIADAALATALAAIPVAVNEADVDLHLPALITAYAAHIASTTVHGSADATNTITAYTAIPGTLIAGDEWSYSTTPPMWAIGDLYTAATPDTGALAVIANSAQNFGILAISEPVTASDIAILKSGLTAMTAKNASKRPTVLVRFRDPTAGESDAAYVAAFATFRAACADDERISIVDAPGILTDLFRGYSYARSAFADILARVQGMAAISGAQGERVAQSLGYTARGPLPNFTIRDSAGNPVGHDEALRSGLSGPLASKGGAICVYYEAHEDVAGTYVVATPACLHGVGASVVTFMDNRVSSGIERALYAVAFSFLGGADTWDPDTLILDDDLRDAMAGAAMAAIKANYANEIQNADDPNLVTVDEKIAVDGPRVTVGWFVNDRLFGYTNRINITIANAR